MVSVKPMGRLGNVLFQYAAAIGYCKKHNLEFSAPSITNDRFHNPTYLPHLVDPRWENGREDVVINEQTLFKYGALPLMEEWRDKQIVLKGYFQSEDYFKDYKEDVFKAFRLPWVPIPFTVGVHVRRGDYLTLTEKHPLVTKKWIESAMGRFYRDHWQFRFFSDDIDWCRNEFGGRDDCYFSTNDELTDLWNMSSCTHQICSASTFSWWASYLNQNEDKIVIMPKKWHGPTHSNQWTEDIVPKNWTRI